MNLPTQTAAPRTREPSTGLYEVLGVPDIASAENIKNGFKKRAKKLHPDLGGSKEDFTKLLNAYRVLRDPEKRKLYDETGEVGEELANNDFAVMLEGLVTLFKAALNAGLSENSYIDPIDAMKVVVKGNIDSAAAEEDKAKAEIKQANTLKKRILRKSKGQNLFVKVLERKISSLLQSEAEAQKRKRILLLALEELENYTCITDVVDIVQFYSFSATSPSAATTSTTWST